MKSIIDSEVRLYMHHISISHQMLFFLLNKKINLKIMAFFIPLSCVKQAHMNKIEHISLVCDLEIVKTHN